MKNINIEKNIIVIFEKIRKEDDMRCKKCNSGNLKIIRAGPHNKLVCVDCLSYQKFLSKSKAKTFLQLKKKEQLKERLKKKDWFKKRVKKSWFKERWFRKEKLV